MTGLHPLNLRIAYTLHPNNQSHGKAMHMHPRFRIPNAPSAYERNRIQSTDRPESKVLKPNTKQSNFNANL